MKKFYNPRAFSPSSRWIRSRTARLERGNEAHFESMKSREAWRSLRKNARRARKLLERDLVRGLVFTDAKSRAQHPPILTASKPCFFII